MAWWSVETGVSLHLAEFDSWQNNPKPFFLIGKRSLTGKCCAWVQTVLKDVTQCLCKSTSELEKELKDFTEN